jgi:hypothetical protein
MNKESCRESRQAEKMEIADDKRNAASFVTGQILPFDGGMTAM